MEIKVTIQCDDSLDAYKVVSKIANTHVVKSVETDEETWVFDQPSDVKFLFRRNFQNESGERIVIT